MQGNVQYSVGQIDISRLTAPQKKIAEMPPDIFFPLGELNPAVSRETLELDDRTIGNVLKAYNEVYDGLLEEVKKKIGECKAAWEAHILIYGLTSAPGLGGIVNDAFNEGKLFGKYPNFRLDSKKLKLNELDMRHVQIIRYTRSERDTAKRAKKEQLFGSGEERRAAMRAELNAGTDKKAFDHVIEANDRVIFVINDLPAGGDRYVHYHLNEAAHATPAPKIAYEIKRSHKLVPTKEVVAEARRILRKLGNPPSVRMSELKKRYPEVDKREPRGHSERRNIVVLRDSIGRSYYRRRHSRGEGWANAWQKSEDQPEGTKYYVALERLKAVESGLGTAYNLLEFTNNVRKALVFGLDEQTPLYGLKKKSKLRKHPDWVELTSHVMAMVPKIMTPEKERELTLILKPFDGDFEDLLTCVTEDRQLLTPDSPVQKFAEALDSAKAGIRDAEEALAALKSVSFVASERGHYKQGEVVDFSKAWRDVLGGYPLLGALDSYKWRSYRRDVIDYINWSDKCRQPEQAMAAASGGEEV